MSEQAERDKLAQQTLIDCLAAAIAAENDVEVIKVIDQNIHEWNVFMVDADKSADGKHGAPLDRYSEGAPLRTAEDPELKAAVDRYVRDHPGVSRAQALNAVLQALGHTPQQQRAA
jgi:hypothetical protein